MTQNTKAMDNISFPAFNATVGDIEGNAQKIISKYHKYEDDAALVVFPELCVTGYPLEDLLFRQQFLERTAQAVERITAQIGSVPCIIGAPVQHDDGIYNSALVLQNGRVVAERQKVHLPNYDVFDEQRYFRAGSSSQPPVNVAGLTFALLICEDTWFSNPLISQVRLGGQFAISINASPWDATKVNKRRRVLEQRARESGVGIAYTNLIGGQDELVFDGGLLLAEPGYPVVREGGWIEDDERSLALLQGQDGPMLRKRTLGYESTGRRGHELYEALKLGLRDYVRKNGFERVVVGVSGGVDSALAATIAVQALGADSVLGIMMPTEYTTQTSINLAVDLCQRLGIQYQEMGVQESYAGVLGALSPLFAGTDQGVAEENLQARIRGAMLMAVSNKMGHMVLSTGNKSEMSVGYSTLYGDMVGGFNVLKDVYKTEVWELCNWINETESEPIPPSIISRPPSAELAHDQRDTDSLPNYYDLDHILCLMIEKEQDVNAIYGQNGYERSTIERVRKLIDRNEYKRRQAPPGVRVSAKSLGGRDRRYPITNRYAESIDPELDNIQEWMQDEDGMA